MIYSNSNISKLPNLDQAVGLINDITHRFPVVHRSPESLIVNDPDVNILTRSGNLYSLRPNISCQGAIFGWHNDYDELMKQQPEEHPIVTANTILTRQYRSSAFKTILASHPFYSLLRDGISIPKYPLSISICDPDGLALSYHLDNSMIPLSSSLEVAAFHASTEYDQVTNAFRPMKDGKTGVIFVFELNERFSLINNLKVIGKQPFLRPGLNKLFALKIDNIRDLIRYPNVKGFRFLHTEQGSHRIFEKFNHGKSLYPNEPLIKKVNRLLSLENFREHRYRAQIRPNPKENRELRDQYVSIFSEDELEHVWFSNANLIWRKFWGKTLFPRLDDSQVNYLLDIPLNPAYKKYFNQNDWNDCNRHEE